MSTRSSQTVSGTSTILDCLLVNGVPIITWINTQITNLQTQINALETDITNLHTDITTIKSQIAALTALIAALQACCASIQQYIANDHKPLALTKIQDVAGAPGARTSLNVGTQVLNIPPAIAARAVSTTPTTIAFERLTPLSLALDYETVPAMVLNNAIIVPRTGRYNIVGSWSTDTEEGNNADGYAMSGGFLINGNNYAGRYTAPIINGRAEQTNQVLPGHLLNAGDAVGIFAYTDFPGGLTVTGQYVAVEYIEGT